MTVLVTGFGPFLSNPVNPAELVARNLHERTLKNNSHEKITSKILPVTTAGVQEIEKELLKSNSQSEYSMILHIGLDAGARQILVECCAFNHAVERPDFDSTRVRSNHISPRYLFS